MSKPFNSDNERDKTLSIDALRDRLRIEIEDRKHLIAIIIDNSHAPAIALAILESAGYGEEVVTDGSPDGHIQVAKYYLYEGVKAHASITAEAEAQAKLEAEALELFNLCAKVQGHSTSDSWENVRPIERKDAWLAVARKAREMRAEK